MKFKKIISTIFDAIDVGFLTGAILLAIMLVGLVVVASMVVDVAPPNIEEENRKLVQEKEALCKESKCTECGYFYKNFNGQVQYFETLCESDYRRKRDDEEIPKEVHALNMLINKKTTRTITETEVEDMLCNKCGESMRYQICTDTGGKPVFDFAGLKEVIFTGGYVSPIFADGYETAFSLCEKCLDELFKTFKYPVIDGYYL